MQTLKATQDPVAQECLTPKYVLCYGHDVVLLKSRKRILELARCPSVVTSNEQTFLESLCSGCPAVTVLCQTLLAEEGQRAASIALEHCPTMPLLILYNQRLKFFPVQTHQFLRSAGGPKLFADTVSDLLYPGKRTEGGLPY